jgi:hypothetical protein
VQIKSIDHGSPAYLRFIGSGSSVYNQPEWLQLYGNACSVMGVYDDDKLLAVFNTFVFKKSLLQFFVPPPFSPDCACLLASGADKKQIADAIQKWMEAYSTKKSLALLRFNFSYKYTDLLEQTKLKGFGKKYHHTYVLNLKDTDDVQSLYAPKRRQQIRRAQKDGLQVKQMDKELPAVYHLVWQTFARQEKTIDEKMVKKILYSFADSNPDKCFSFGSFLDGKCILAYFCIHHGKEAFYLLGGYDSTVKHIGAGPLAMNACIEHAKKLGIEVFDFEGSMEPSIEKYFKEFGGEKKLYPCFEKTNKLGDMAVKLKKIVKGR